VTIANADERRLVTVLFADLVGFSSRAEAADPEQVRELQRAYFAVVSREVERYGGTLEKYIGDAVMAIFGAPQAHDDDAERALRAALRIRESVTSLAADLEVRIGVNTGEVVGGPGSGPHAGDYTVSGDAVNVAARLQQTAGPGEVLVGAATRRLSAEAFTFAPLAELELKGRREATEAWRLERELPERPRLRGGEARLFGRTREMAALESALQEAAEGRGLLVALVGEPGIGKSRLALEARNEAEASGFATAWTTSRSYASAFPYHLVGQLVQQLLGRPEDGTAAALRDHGVKADDAAVERWSAVLDDLLGEETADDGVLAELSPAGRQRMLVHAIEALLRAASERAPMMVVLDDLHWADPASLAVVEELLDVVAELRVLLLATYRSGWSHGWEGRSAYEQLNLRALQPAEARAMAAELMTGAGAGDEITQRVLERSAGNPLFLEELARGEHPHRLPETIHEMLLARLDALPAGARRVLQLASVVGMEFGEGLVTSLAADGDGTDEAAHPAAESLRTLQRTELIVARASDAGERTLAFRHPLIHEVAYRSLLTNARRALHGRIARRLEAIGGEEVLPELARHYGESDDPDKARHYLPLAGARAEALNANREAHRWFSEAAEAYRDDPARRAAMIEAAARQQYLLGEIEPATDQQDEAIRLYESAGAERAALNARRWLGRYRWLLGDPVEADRQIGLAIEGLERMGPSPELAMAYSFRSQSVMLEPDYEAGETWARKAIEVANATGGTEALVHAYNNLGFCLMEQDDAQGVEHLRHSLELALANHLPDDVGRAYANLSGQGARIFPFAYAESEALLREAIEYAARTIPDGIFDLWIRSGYSEFLIATAQWSDADRVLGALKPLRGQAYLDNEIASLHAHLAVYRGRADDAAALTSDIADAALRIGDVQAVLPTLAAHAAALAGQGNDAAAITVMQRAIDRRGDSREPTISSWFLFESTDTLAVIARRDGGSAALAKGLDLISGFAQRLAPRAVARGDLVQAQVRRAMFGAAVDQLRALGAPPLEAGDADGLPGRAEAALLLDGEHRYFDAARARLWLAEEKRDATLLAGARERFEELAAHDYLARSDALSGVRR
jgi:adenylate cyclase